MSASSWGLEEWRAFPPLYTLQPVESTRQQQLKVWVDVLHDWAARHGRTSVVLADCDAFKNDAISRALPPAAIRAVAEALILDGRAEWEDADEPGARLRVHRQSPAVLALRLVDWTISNGMVGGVYTLAELSDKSDVENPCFKADERLLRRALAILEIDGKCEVFQGTATKSDGVKFYA
ncbi:ESCRT-II complex subunit-domain-containing protein [Pelagophyceae sp. CCMP2097]|nr:ESCRT-II complex subunit-domain-containing protein [Pelagophyceae sp. CCMP2097]